MPRMKDSVPVGAVVLTKSREDEKGFILTNYAVAQEGGLESLPGKKEASEVLAEQMLAFMRQHDHFPPDTEVRKTFKNSKVDLNNAADQYDKFTLRLTPELVGGDGTQFLEKLSEPQEAKGVKKQRSGVSMGGVEVSKGGRAKCFACGEQNSQGRAEVLCVDSLHVQTGECRA